MGAGLGSQLRTVSKAENIVTSQKRTHTVSVSARGHVAAGLGLREVTSTLESFGGGGGLEHVAKPRRASSGAPGGRASEPGRVSSES